MEEIQFENKTSADMLFEMSAHSIEERYIEVCKGFKRPTPPTMIHRSELQQWKQSNESSQDGLFASICAYPTTDPYMGEVIAPLYLDWDQEDNPDKARKEAAATIRKLIDEYKIPESAISIAFSGCKGISSTIPPEIFNAQPSKELPLIWKSIAKELQARLHLKTLDTGVYDRRRLWRIINSRHDKTGLYKIPLTLTELENLGIDKIRTLAAAPRELNIQSQSHPIPEAERLYLEHKEKVENWLSARKPQFQKETLKTTDDPPCIKRLIESGAQKGNRNLATFQLAVYYAGKGHTEEDIINLCTQFAAKSDQPLTEQEIDTLVDSAVKGYTEGRYSVGCSTFADLCNKDKCPLFNAEEKPSWDKIGTPITYDEWQTTIQANFPALWPYAEACASTITVLQIQDVQPLALVLQGVPSGGKTTTLDFFKHFPFSHLTDRFSARAFVSHVAQKTEEELTKIDLLPRLKGRVLISPDLTTLFGLKAEELADSFAILTRVLDGRGLTIDSGVYGSRGYEGDYMFSWIGATTPIPHKVWELFGNLGARMFFMQITASNKTDQDYVRGLKEKNYRKKVDECNDATLRFLKGIWREQRLEWNSQGDPDDIIEKLVLVAKVVTRLRGKINVAVKEETGGESKTYNTEAIIEEPDRCIATLYTLARGHALLKGRSQITADDLPVVLDVALSSAPWDRIKAFACVLAKDKVNAFGLEQNMNCSRNTALRMMETLKLLDLVDLGKSTISTAGGEQFAFEMSLKKKFEWFHSDEFKSLWRQQIQYKEASGHQLQPREVLIERFEELETPAANQGA